MAEWLEQPAPYDENKSRTWNRYRDRGTIRCTCGAKVNLTGAAEPPDYAASCGKCGALYNLSGQGLRPRNEWEG